MKYSSQYIINVHHKQLEKAYDIIHSTEGMMLECSYQIHPIQRMVVISTELGIHLISILFKSLDSSTVRKII